ncbi:MAG: hemerythrin domain-containing protein [bacterium]|nr:hemerythrin domain-containing protein [bacterium]
MARIDKLRKQHDELMAAIEEIRGLLEVDKLIGDPNLVLEKMTSMYRQLMIHLAIEDKYFYPELLNSGDPQLIALAEKYIEEMGNIGEAFSAYRNTWIYGTVIKADPQKYIQATNEIFEALSERISTENEVLYPEYKDMVSR